MTKTKGPKVLNFARKVLFKVTYEFSKGYSEQIFQISHWIHLLSLYYAHDCLKNEEKLKREGRVYVSVSIFFSPVKLKRFEPLSSPVRRGAGGLATWR